MSASEPDAGLLTQEELEAIIADDGTDEPRWDFSPLLATDPLSAFRSHAWLTLNGARS